MIVDKARDMQGENVLKYIPNTIKDKGYDINELLPVSIAAMDGIPAVFFKINLQEI